MTRATLPGYARRFWQGSPDHRGTPLAPGRVVTLVSALEDSCVGVAYRLFPERAESVIDELDFRERAGFVRTPVRLIREDGASLDAFTYLADPENPYFLGDAPLFELAAQIAERSGPSGANSAYVFELARALRELGVEADHVYEVEAELSAFLERARAD
jgi:cation transport protein ChaC